MKTLSLEICLPNLTRSRRIVTCVLAVLAASAISMRAQMGDLVGTWAASPMEAAAGNAGKADETLRQIVHVSIPGTESTTVVLTNEFGREPLVVQAVTIAHRVSESTTDAPVAVTFAGKTSVTIAPGTRVLSDAMHFTFPAQSDLAISLFVPAQRLSSITAHPSTFTTNYSAPGDQTSSTVMATTTVIGPWRYLAEIDVSTATQSAIVCLGDSITDGTRSTKDTNQRWPDLLAARLLADKRFATRFGVLNEGIGGNRILHDGSGPSALARFDRDVSDTSGYGTGRSYVIVLEGINDIGHAHDPRLAGKVGKREDVVTADELIAAYRLLAVRAHAKHLRIIGATLTPYIGAMYASPEGETERQALNAWIRTATELDGLIDFDKATRDPANPSMFLPAYDSGDHLHPNDAGMKAMAASIDLGLFAK